MLEEWALCHSDAYCAVSKCHDTGVTDFPALMN